ncbi:Crp/Fnr family transcriptional regulator [Bradyrhizobium sp. UFLA01-814]|uniref:Crp/Fnr family transcriptional regulator n=1 Tax=Bradyrhizobium sp. UFLA01-814 TaxID=3023480 RepID=UPI00398B3563
MLIENAEKHRNRMLRLDGERGKVVASSRTQSCVKNTILARLSVQDLAAISSCLEPIVLRARTVLHEPKRRPEHVYFVEIGLISLRIVAGGSILETALQGHRGAVGASFLLGGHLPTYQAAVLFPGTALRIQVDDLRRIMDERPQIQDVISTYVQSLALHSAQTGLCAARHTREQRLALWLCLACDALDYHVLPVTHDYLSTALGLRRAGITETLIRFEEQGLIRKSRGVLKVDDHKQLRLKACSCYGAITDAYASPEGPGYGKRERDRTCWLATS